MFDSVRVVLWAYFSLLLRGVLGEQGWYLDSITDIIVLIKRCKIAFEFDAMNASRTVFIRN